MEVRKILKTEQGLLDIITDWMHDWWGEDLHRTYEEVKHFTEHSAEDDRLPQTYGLFVEGELVGLYQFRLDDLFVRPDIYNCCRWQGIIWTVTSCICIPIMWGCMINTDGNMCRKSIQ